MKIIDEYLNNLYKDDDSKDAKEIKEEIREHLITSTKEYIEDGYSEIEAQNKAIKQFDGDCNEEESLELRSIYTKKIDVKMERVKKLGSLRLKMINVFGWFFGAACLVAYNSLYKKLPIWLTITLTILIAIIIILSIIIFTLKLNMRNE